MKRISENEHGMTVWLSGLRRWLQAPVRKGVGSNPTAVSEKHGRTLPECHPVLQLCPIFLHSTGSPTPLVFVQGESTWVVYVHLGDGLLQLADLGPGHCRVMGGSPWGMGEGMRGWGG